MYWLKQNTAIVPPPTHQCIAKHGATPFDPVLYFLHIYVACKTGSTSHCLLRNYLNRIGWPELFLYAFGRGPVGDVADVGHELAGSDQRSDQ